MKHFLYQVLFFLIIVLVGFAAVMYATSPKVWHAGKHDSRCEGENCHCYERLVNAEH